MDDLLDDTENDVDENVFETKTKFIAELKDKKELYLKTMSELENYKMKYNKCVISSIVSTRINTGINIIIMVIRSSLFSYIFVYLEFHIFFLIFFLHDCMKVIRVKFDPSHSR